MTARTDVDESLRRVRLAAELNATAARRQQEKLDVLREWDRAVLTALTAAHPALTIHPSALAGWSE
ncbi:hypothetical protein F4556_003411 [Kitasatospora gansuensis]|uniref:Uncharacterized protein n=1 Tax=Kitasatospora gansuensis TaxID=258050 RepID=A0A7W7SEG8_9ACTN|nr:hypothetical protein [Kitasatospora gansuensis]MBB4947876.1 hypothetical protein [Kitasatospora gansuensis]